MLRPGTGKRTGKTNQSNNQACLVSRQGAWYVRLLVKAGVIPRVQRNYPYIVYTLWCCVYTGLCAYFLQDLQLVCNMQCKTLGQHRQAAEKI